MRYIVSWHERIIPALIMSQYDPKLNLKINGLEKKS